MSSGFPPGSSAAQELLTVASEISPTHRLGGRGGLRSPLSRAAECAAFSEPVGAARGCAARARMSADWLRVLLPLTGATGYGTHVAWWYNAMPKCR